MSTSKEKKASEVIFHADPRRARNARRTPDGVGQDVHDGEQRGAGLQMSSGTPEICRTQYFRDKMCTSFAINARRARRGAARSWVRGPGGRASTGTSMRCSPRSSPAGCAGRRNKKKENERTNTSSGATSGHTRADQAAARGAARSSENAANGALRSVQPDLTPVVSVSATRDLRATPKSKDFERKLKDFE